jgi:hypothetical protein
MGSVAPRKVINLVRTFDVSWLLRLFLRRIPLLISPPEHPYLLRRPDSSCSLAYTFEQFAA